VVGFVTLRPAGFRPRDIVFTSNDHANGEGLYGLRVEKDTATDVADISRAIRTAIPGHYVGTHVFVGPCALVKRDPIAMEVEARGVVVVR
jgi:hypothetical protein